MTKTKTVTEQTIHGSIEYSVVECDSCGQDVMEDEANEFTIGDREGYACDMCVREGPSGFPMGKKVNWKVALGFTFAWPLVALAIAHEADEGEFNEKMWMWVAGSLGVAIYGIAILSIGGAL